MTLTCTATALVPCTHRHCLRGLPCERVRCKEAIATGFAGVVEGAAAEEWVLKVRPRMWGRGSGGYRNETVVGLVE